MVWFLQHEKIYSPEFGGKVDREGLDVRDGGRSLRLSLRLEDV